EQNADLISIGAYKPGMNHRLDEAVKKIDSVNSFLMQPVGDSFSMEDTLQLMQQI
ncbi:MAG: flagellum-specific ATP synthase FliI, partial [Bacillota bacterium]|nr:flagellum-specific ATP synthase FliI [Bacillota bacterium]